MELLEEEPGEEPEEELEEDEAGDGFKLFNALYISNRIWLGSDWDLDVIWIWTECGRIQPDSQIKSDL